MTAYTHEYAYIDKSIFYDLNFSLLDWSARSLYTTLALDQHLNYCGVMTWEPERLSTYSADTTPEMVEQWAEQLAAHGFVILDRDTNEIWFRPLFESDPELLHKKDNIHELNKDYPSVQSPRIRIGIHMELERLRLIYPEWGQWDNIDWGQMEKDMDGE